MSAALTLRQGQREQAPHPLPAPLPPPPTRWATMASQAVAQSEVRSTRLLSWILCVGVGHGRHQSIQSIVLLWKMADTAQVMHVCTVLACCQVCLPQEASRKFNMAKARSAVSNRTKVPTLTHVSLLPWVIVTGHRMGAVAQPPVPRFSAATRHCTPHTFRTCMDCPCPAISCYHGPLCPSTKCTCRRSNCHGPCGQTHYIIDFGWPSMQKHAPQLNSTVPGTGSANQANSWLEGSCSFWEARPDVRVPRQNLKAARDTFCLHMQPVWWHGKLLEGLYGTRFCPVSEVEVHTEHHVPTCPPRQPQPLSHVDPKPASERPEVALHCHLCSQGRLPCITLNERALRKASRTHMPSLSFALYPTDIEYIIV